MSYADDERRERYDSNLLVSQEAMYTDGKCFEPTEEQVQAVLKRRAMVRKRKEREAMTNKTVRYFAEALACSAELEGMKALNIERQRNGYALAYGDDAFQEVANKLTHIAECAAK